MELAIHKPDNSSSKESEITKKWRDESVKIIRALNNHDASILRIDEFYRNSALGKEGLDSNTPREKCENTIETQTRRRTIIQNVSHLGMLNREKGIVNV